MLKIENNFDLKSTVTCGQIFRYFIEDNKLFQIVLNSFPIKKVKNNRLGTIGLRTGFNSIFLNCIIQKGLERFR